jgi:hypothetical protein
MTQQNGKKVNAKWVLEVIPKPVAQATSCTSPDSSMTDEKDLRTLMLQSMKDAASVVAAVPELAFRAEDTRAIGLSIFIAKAKTI